MWKGWKSPVLGNCNSGYNFDKIYELYVEDYAKYFSKVCDKCWARPMCSICYERTMGENGVIPHVEDMVCDGSRRIIKDLFVNYYRFFEKDKALLENLLSQYTISWAKIEICHIRMMLQLICSIKRVVCCFVSEIAILTEVQPIGLSNNYDYYD